MCLYKNLVVKYAAWVSVSLSVSDRNVGKYCHVDAGSLCVLLRVQILTDATIIVLWIFLFINIISSVQAARE